MNQFKVGDEVVINLLTGGYSGKLKVGSVAIIGEFSINRRFARMVGELDIEGGWHNLAKIKHAEKWSIYNNALPWSQLSDKQKGKMLVADNNGIRFHCFSAFGRPKFNICNEVYTAVEPEPVKPEPTMAELFDADSESFDFRGSGDFPEYMIAKGWTKPCK
jgi:hypothetical protein